MNKLFDLSEERIMEAVNSVTTDKAVLFYLRDLILQRSDILIKRILCIPARFDLYNYYVKIDNPNVYDKIRFGSCDDDVYDSIGRSMEKLWPKYLVKKCNLK